jgi:hypothetical protein
MPYPTLAVPTPCSGHGMAPLPRCRSCALVLAYVGARLCRYFPSLTLSALSSLPTTGTRARSPWPPEHTTAITILSFSTPARHLLVLPVPSAPHGLHRPRAPSIRSSSSHATHSRWLPPPLSRAPVARPPWAILTMLLQAIGVVDHWPTRVAHSLRCHREPPLPPSCPSSPRHASCP